MKVPRCMYEYYDVSVLRAPTARPRLAVANSSVVQLSSLGPSEESRHRDVDLSDVARRARHPIRPQGFKLQGQNRSCWRVVLPVLQSGHVASFVA
jgi:hypothetical protein